ncbi:MAG TPA: hypothetical protein VFT86_11530 [Gaiellaceae bacterium]|nr:hypothetical protein [Gaiellaceae bacterium]
MRPLADSMKPYVFATELLRVEAEWLLALGRERDARELLLRAIDSARGQGSLALAVRSAVSLSAASDDKKADLELLGSLCAHLPEENDTDYRRGAEGLLGGAVPSSLT